MANTASTVLVALLLALTLPFDHALLMKSPRRESQRRSVVQCSSTSKKSAGAATSPPKFEYAQDRIRNFCIIAHIDHGKSTLADRLIEYTGTVAQRDMQAQLLDTMDIERERGITIKLNTARMEYLADDGLVYQLNLIDTPGHVDFSYEVSRSLAACEGALLVVDASQGIEAQTLANTYLAVDGGLEIVPVLNKIDLPAADPDRVAEEVENSIGLDCTEAIHASAKNGIGIKDILEAVVRLVPPPPPPPADMPLKALIYDSFYESYRGVIVSFRVVSGEMKKGDKITFMNSKSTHEITELGVTVPAQVKVDTLKPGEVGYLCASIKSVDDARVGDTITLAKNPAAEPLAGYAEAVPMVFCGLFPVDADQYELLRDSLGKMRLNDAALSFEPETSSAMGFGFRCGFLGLLHMEIVQERLEREYDLDLIVTAPSVVYEFEYESGEVVIVDNPAKMPDGGKDKREVREPYVKMEVFTPTEYVGALMELAQSRRGILKDVGYLTQARSKLVYELPLAEVISDFFDELKSRSKGYASMEYTQIGYRANDLVRLDIKINGEDASPLASIAHRDAAYGVGKKLTEKLRDLIPRQMFKVPIQACIGVKPIASSVIPPMRKDVLAKCYGGDITRKKKLLQKQAKGKKRMKAMGKVNVPQEAFMAVINVKRDMSD